VERPGVVGWHWQIEVVAVMRRWRSDGKKIHRVLWSLAVHAAVHHDAQLVCDLLMYIEPLQLGVQQEL